MIDLTLCVLACAKKEKYIKRLKEFHDIYGFKNKYTKFTLVYLVEDEEKPEFIKNAVWYKCGNIPLSLRWLYYLKNNKKISSNWIMQVDDDSSTDIDKTVEILNQFYDCEDPMILMGGRNADLESGQQKILKEMKIENIFCGKDNINDYDAVPHFIHAWEPSIISKSGIKKLQKWKHLESYYNHCIKVKPTFGDQTPYVAAKLAKIPIVETSFLCPFEVGYQYSGINKNGQFSHIHYVTEKWNCFEKFKDALQNNKMFENDELAKNYLISDIPNKENIMEGSSWKFYGNGKYYGILVLGHGGVIQNYYNDNERFWKFEDDKITIMDKNKNVTTVFSKTTNDKYEGKFVKNTNVIHTLDKLK